MTAHVWSAGKGAVFLTALGAVSQLLAFVYRVALSRLIGAEVMGLYQLVMPVYGVLLSLTAVGLTAAVSNLTSQYLALGNSRGVAQTIKTCLRLFFLFLLPVGGVVIAGSDLISVHLLGDARTQLGLILLVPCVALTGVENFHKHFFYGSGLVQPPAAVELLEQLIRTGAVLGLLLLFLPQYPERVVGLIVCGMVICEVFSSAALLMLSRSRLRRDRLRGPGESPAVRRRRVAAIALPVGLNAVLGNLMEAANAALIPQKLVASGLAREAAISQFGVVCGMTLPMLALPTVFLGPLNLVLVPRLARACALGQTCEIQRLAGRAMSVVSLLALPSMAMMAVLGRDLGQLMFAQPGVGDFLLPLSVITCMSCFCSVLGSILNGIGQQKAVAAVSLLGGAVQLLFTMVFVPLPGFGMRGYIIGAGVATALEGGLYLILSVHRAGLQLSLFRWLMAPGLSSLLAALNCNLLLRILKDEGLDPTVIGLICLTFFLTVYLLALHAQGISLFRTLFSRSRRKPAKK